MEFINVLPIHKIFRLITSYTYIRHSILSDIVHGELPAFQISLCICNIFQACHKERKRVATESKLSNPNSDLSKVAITSSAILFILATQARLAVLHPCHLSHSLMQLHAWQPLLTIASTVNSCNFCGLVSITLAIEYIYLHSYICNFPLATTLL